MISDDINLFNFKLRLFDLTEFIVWNIKGLRHWVAKIMRLEKWVCDKRSVPFFKVIWLSEAKNIFKVFISYLFIIKQFTNIELNLLSISFNGEQTGNGGGGGGISIYLFYNLSINVSIYLCIYISVTNLDDITSLVFYNLNSSLAKTQGSLYVHTGKRLIRY